SFARNQISDGCSDSKRSSVNRSRLGMESGTLSNCSVFSSFPQAFGTLHRRFNSTRRRANEQVPKGDICVAHWLMKSEPESYCWSDLVRDGGTEWDGVRNNAARLHLKAMRVGDEAFLYHSMSDK